MRMQRFPPALRAVLAGLTMIALSSINPCLSLADTPSLPSGQPQVVAVGAGSYASFPPTAAADPVKSVLLKPVYIDNLNGAAIPTSKWWTNAAVSQFTGKLWVLPLGLSTDNKGVSVFYPIKWNDSGSDPVSESPLLISGGGFSPTDSRVEHWGDWTLTFREEQSSAAYLDVTVARGVPLIWVEPHAVAPQLVCENGSVLFDSAGNKLTQNFSGTNFGIYDGERYYGVYLPTGSKVVLASNNVLDLNLPPGSSFFSIAALPDWSKLKTFAAYAYTVPRDSQMTYSYSPEKGTVTTNWHLTTQCLQGTDSGVLQGFLPHHYHETVNNLKFTGDQYLSPRGAIKLAVGNDFQLSYRFDGLLPFFPAAHPTGQPFDYSEQRMRDYLANYATKTDYGDDTYWGGKSLTQYAQYMSIASQMGDPRAAQLQSSLTAALTDWYTYTPGEKSHYFARYDRWHALIGFNSSYGSESFNDNHFHYGYFTTATAMLGFRDPAFLKSYGPMAKLVAREYANWDRTDQDFPYFRMFDTWEGHSWAGGYSGGTGNNQESSSEAVQSWYGLFLLGEALNDKDMAAAGAMGYTMETDAAREYWFDVHGTNKSPNWKHPMTGMVWGGGNLYGTYFSGDPMWVYGINCLPISPGLQYIGRDQPFAANLLHTMLKEQAAKGTNQTVSAMGPALGNVILGAASVVDPDWAAQQEDQLWNANDPVMHNNDTAGLSYYYTNIQRDLGTAAWDWHTSSPLSQVFHNSRLAATEAIVYNPDSAPEKVTVYNNDTAVTSITVPARAEIVCTIPDHK